MYLDKDDILQNDINELVDKFEGLTIFNNKTIFITGATGLLGSQLIKVLLTAKRSKGINLNIVALVRSMDKANKVFKEAVKEITLVLGNVDSEIQYEGKIDYFIHAASPTSSKYFVSNPVETILTTINGTKNVLQLAYKSNVESFVYLSSLEVYGIVNGDKEITEDISGYIDSLNIRSSYSLGKRMAECLCVSYGKEYNLPVKIARLSQTFGPGIDYNDNRVFAQFARDVIEKNDIVLHTQGNTIRTYCYTIDAIEAIITILIKGTNFEAYNVSNKDTAISIRDMAQLVCNLYDDSNIHVVFDIPNDVSSFGYNPEMIVKLDTTKLENLGWKAKHGIEDMYRNMIAYLRANYR